MTMTSRENQMMNKRFWNVKARFQSLPRFGLLLLGCLGISVATPSWGQAPMPSAAAKQEVAPEVVDPLKEKDDFLLALEALSKKYNVAFVAEGKPFPKARSASAPVSDGEAASQVDGEGNYQSQGLTPEEWVVQQVAARFDYTAVHQDNVYLLTKRYSTPEDMPDVTPEECRNGLRMAERIVPRGRVFIANGRGTFAPTPEGALAADLNKRSMFTPTAEQWDRMRSSGVPASELHIVVAGDAWETMCEFYFRTHREHIRGTLTEKETRLPYNPYFHWKTIDRVRVFGYDTILVDFIPMSDAQRVVVSPYNATLPRPDFTIRNDFALPISDPTDPTGLSEQARGRLDDNEKSSHAVSLAQTVKTLNRRAGNSTVYDVDAMYGKKQVTLVGVERVSPDILMQSLATVYGLHVGRRGNATVLMSPPLIEPHSYPELERALIHVIPAPLYRALHIRTGRPQRANLPPGSPESPAPAVTIEAYQVRGAAMHSMVLRMFRYLAQQRLKPESRASMRLSQFGERAQDLFEVARMVRVYAGLCGIADCPLPPYLTDQVSDFIAHVTLYGGYFGAENTGTQIVLSLVYSNQNTGMKYGPVNFFNYVIPPTQSNTPIEKTTIRRGN
ncbi:MAG: hypothetical protein JWN14_1658 [Chthonomonadales bacterium]|nr:hypothetical protein [Chthonomonadales bacterium]